MTIDRKILRRFSSVLFLAPVVAALLAVSAVDSPASDAGKKLEDNKSSSDTTMTLKGGEEGTLFESLRVEGEDRVRVRFERPALNLALDPGTAPGLNWQNVNDVIARSGVDLVAPYLARSAGERPTCFSRPWLATLATGGVARFRPAVEGVDRWRLLVADSKGDTVASFEGNGKPPKEIVWDGRSLSGKLAAPGLIYSYVLEAYDRAGNKRNFVGEGFELPPYRVEGDSPAVMFSGAELANVSADYGSDATPSVVVLEAASWLNQESEVTAPIKVEITARDFKQAKYLADEIQRQLQPLLVGDPLRVRTVTEVQPDAPERGTVAISLSS
ncbi:MAG: hypothetical protein PVF33_12870 [Candidatus Latescibacterota bacterium]|jgi:hypothetical protein